MIQLNVPDMTCGHCVSTIIKAVKAADPAATIDVSLGDKLVQVESSLSPAELAACIAAAGYAARPIAS